MDFNNQPGPSQIIKKMCRICKKDVKDQCELTGIQRDNIFKLISRVMTRKDYEKPFLVCPDCLRRLILKRLFLFGNLIVKERTDKPVNNVRKSTSDVEFAAKDLLFSLMNNEEKLYSKLDQFIKKL